MAWCIHFIAGLIIVLLIYLYYVKRESKYKLLSLEKIKEGGFRLCVNHCMNLPPFNQRVIVFYTDNYDPRYYTNLRACSENFGTERFNDLIVPLLNYELQQEEYLESYTNDWNYS